MNGRPHVTFAPSSRIAGLGVSAIMQIDAEAARMRMQGHSIINLGVGEPDLPTETRVLNATVTSLQQGFTKYTATDGTQHLKQSIATFMEPDLGYHPSESQIICTAGAKQAIANAMLASLELDDEVLIPIPSWTSYFSIVSMAGGRPICVSHSGSNPGSPPIAEALHQKIGPKTRWIILNSPSNPTGKIVFKADLLAIAGVLRAHPAIRVLSDEIYHKLVFDDAPFPSLAAVAPDLRDRILTVNGTSKTFSMTGFRIGWAIGDIPLIQAMTVVQSQTTSCPNAPGQQAAIEALSHAQDHIVRLRVHYQNRRDHMLSQLSSVPGLKADQPAGGLFVWANCQGLMGSTAPNGTRLMNDQDVARHLLNFGVAVVPGCAFQGNGHLRIAFAADLEALSEAGSRMKRAIASLS